MLAQTIALYLLAALVLPDFFGDAPVDLSDYRYGQRRWFFSLLALLVAVSPGRQLVLEGRLPRPADPGFHLLFAAVAVSGTLIGDLRYHAVLVLCSTVAVGSYIALSFTHLH